MFCDRPRADDSKKKGQKSFTTEVKYMPNLLQVYRSKFVVSKTAQMLKPYKKKILRIKFRILINQHKVIFIL
jgi:hypothetical protein